MHPSMAYYITTKHHLPHLEPESYSNIVQLIIALGKLVSLMDGILVQI